VLAGDGLNIPHPLLFSFSPLYHQQTTLLAPCSPPFRVRRPSTPSFFSVNLDSRSSLLFRNKIERRTYFQESAVPIIMHLYRSTASRHRCARPPSTEGRIHHFKPPPSTPPVERPCFSETHRRQCPTPLNTRQHSWLLSRRTPSDANPPRSPAASSLPRKGPRGLHFPSGLGGQGRQRRYEVGVSAASGAIFEDRPHVRERMREARLSYNPTEGTQPRSWVGDAGRDGNVFRAGVDGAAWKT